MRTNKRIVKYVLIVILFFIAVLILYRNVSSVQLDDVSPQIQCDEKLFQKADILFIIPLFNNQSIAENKTWCEYILSLNKTLAMHGVYHSYDEFLIDRNNVYLNKGKEEFFKCFGLYPKEFKAPQLAISGNNKKLVESSMKLDGYFNQFLHKAYHCSDSGQLSNRFIDWI